MTVRPVQRQFATERVISQVFVFYNVYTNIYDFKLIFLTARRVGFHHDLVSSQMAICDADSAARLTIYISINSLYKVDVNVNARVFANLSVSKYYIM
jgi:hypothetical protein